MSRLPPFEPIDPVALLTLHVPEQCGGCARLESEAPSVTLLAGQVVCTYCPAWQEETRLRQIEAYQVLDLPDRATRQNWLAKREHEFGAEYRRRLEAVIMATWKRQQASTAQPDGDDAS